MSLEEDVRQLIIDGEEALRESRAPAKQKAALQPQYELYLKVLSRSKQPKVVCAEDYLRVVEAMRDDLVSANLGFAPAGDHPSVERIVSSRLRVMGAYLERLPETVVLIVERGVGVLTMFALRGGSDGLEDRIALERASKQCVEALIDLMKRQGDDIERIRRDERITKAFFAPFEQAAGALWAALPEAIRAAISGSRSILFMPSAFGDLAGFPLEVLRTEEGWLGATHSISRLSSMRTLLELLSPNRMPSKLDARAMVVRAQDSKELTKADAEVDAVSRQLERLGLEVEVDRAPHVATVRAALDRGLRVLHYCGHGFAGRLGESLPLAASETMGPHDFSQLSGWGTPFVYLSTCEVGRARMTTTGSAAGVSTRLIEKGAPAVVGCLASVPDLVASAMADAFYQAAATLPLGEALATARKARVKVPPACWGVFGYFGDPALQLISRDGAVPQTRRRTLRWDALVGRHLATRTAESRQRVLDAIAAERGKRAGAGDMLKRVAHWLERSFRAEDPAVADERLELCRAVAERDAVAGCELRMLLAMEALHGSYYGKRKPDLVVNPEAIVVGLYCAKAVHDVLAWAAFAIESARGAGAGYAPGEQLHMLDEAEGSLDGWQLEEPAAASMLSTARRLRDELVHEQTG